MLSPTTGISWDSALRPTRFNRYTHPQIIAGPNFGIGISHGSGVVNWRLYEDTSRLTGARYVFIARISSPRSLDSLRPPDVVYIFRRTDQPRVFYHVDEAKLGPGFSTRSFVGRVEWAEMNRIIDRKEGCLDGLGGVLLDFNIQHEGEASSVTGEDETSYENEETPGKDEYTPIEDEKMNNREREVNKADEEIPNADEEVHEGDQIPDTDGETPGADDNEVTQTTSYPLTGSNLFYYADTSIFYWITTVITTDFLVTDYTAPTPRAVLLDIGLGFGDRLRCIRFGEYFRSRGLNEYSGVQVGDEHRSVHTNDFVSTISTDRNSRWEFVFRLSHGGETIDDFDQIWEDIRIRNGYNASPPSLAAGVEVSRNKQEGRAAEWVNGYQPVSGEDKENKDENKEEGGCGGEATGNADEAYEVTRSGYSTPLPSHTTVFPRVVSGAEVRSNEQEDQKRERANAHRPGGGGGDGGNRKGEGSMGGEESKWDNEEKREEDGGEVNCSNESSAVTGIDRDTGDSSSSSDREETGSDYNDTPPTPPAGSKIEPISFTADKDTRIEDTSTEAAADRVLTVSSLPAESTRSPVEREQIIQYRGSCPGTSPGVEVRGDEGIILKLSMPLASDVKVQHWPEEPQPAEPQEKLFTSLSDLIEHRLKAEGGRQPLFPPNPSRLCVSSLNLTPPSTPPSTFLTVTLPPRTFEREKALIRSSTWETYLHNATADNMEPSRGELPINWGLYSNSSAAAREQTPPRVDVHCQPKSRSEQLAAASKQPPDPSPEGYIHLLAKMQRRSMRLFHIPQLAGDDEDDSPDRHTALSRLYARQRLLGNYLSRCSGLASIHRPSQDQLDTLEALQQAVQGQIQVWAESLSKEEGKEDEEDEEDEDKEEGAGEKEEDEEAEESWFWKVLRVYNRVFDLIWRFWRMRS